MILQIAKRQLLYNNMVQVQEIKDTKIPKSIEIIAFSESQRTAILKISGYEKGKTIKYPLQVNQDFEFIYNGDESQVIEF